MNPLESELDYPFGDTVPEPGAAHQVAPGVWWLRMGLPFALNHINLWLLEDTLDGDDGPIQGWTVIDCGVANEATKSAWEMVFAHHLQGLPILRVIATHCHPDHIGLADWLCARWRAPLWMTAGLAGADGTAMFPHFQRHGLQDPLMLERLQARKSYYSNMVPAVPEAYIRMQEGQRVQIGRHGWQVITGFGHAPEHAALYAPDLGLLVSGDMILPRISTNVSVFAIEPEANPVQLYLDSLDKYAILPPETLVLPSHGKPFKGLQARIRQLRDHHAARLAEVLAACSAPCSAADIVPIMFTRALDAHQLTFAMGEALAHLHKLWFDGLLRRRIDDDGVVRFQARHRSCDRLGPRQS